MRGGYAMQGLGQCEAPRAAPISKPPSTELEDHLRVLIGHEEALHAAGERLRALGDRLFGAVPEEAGNECAPTPTGLMAQVDYKGRDLTPLIQAIFAQIERLERL